MIRYAFLLSVLLIFGFGTLSTGKAKEHVDIEPITVKETLAQASATKPMSQTPKNIILMIGDGMGLSQVTAALYSNNNQLNLEQFPVTGLMKTSASNHLITDSAAGATAFSCGCKTYNGAIGMDKKGKPCRHLIEDAKERGLAAGLVSTSAITHATPASFIGHVEQRVQMESVAETIANSDLDFFVGGGLGHFTKRKDGRNLVKEMTQKGRFVSDWREMPLEDMRPSTTRTFGWFAHEEQPVSVKKGRTYLPIAGRMAPEFLKERSDKGFFLMIEGAQIDWGGHSNNTESTIEETLDFDQTVGEVLRWAQEDGETLVIVTADHETGGMSILYGSEMNDLKVKWTTDYHTATLVPVFAFGPGSEKFAGIYDNTQIYFKMRTLFGWEAVLGK